MVVGYRRLGVLGCMLAFAALALAVTPAAPSPAAAKLDATLTAEITGGAGWCCGESVDFEGSGAVMGMGRVDFTGHWLGGCSFFSLPTPCFRRLDLELVTRNGDRLVLRGNDEWTQPADPAPAVTTWTTDPVGSTGRFAGLSSSGTYVFSKDQAGTTASISLTGTSPRKARG